MRTAQRLSITVVIVALAVALLVSGGSIADLLCLAPSLPLLGLVLLGRYVGEDALAHLAARRAPRRRRAATVQTGVHRLSRRRPRGGCLLADSLAERGPPGFAA